MQEKTRQSKQNIKTIFENFNQITNQLDMLLKLSIETIKKTRISDDITENNRKQTMLPLIDEELQSLRDSFTLQYLMLQQNMQAQNRQFAMVSNIVKIKHDTVKAAINNVR